MAVMGSAEAGIAVPSHTARNCAVAACLRQDCDRSGRSNGVSSLSLLPIHVTHIDVNEDFKQAALDYHRMSPPGKIKVSATKPMLTQRDLSLAYSPGVAYACEAIKADPQQASELTARGNLVAVISNGTAVLGLGNIGALAGKPVMEGKGVLFQKFAGIDVFDIEVDETDPDKLVDIIASLEPTFGGINLEDIKAPECFVVERKLRERMKIPVFHDDQHGTAIIVGAAVLNAMAITGKKIEEVKLATTGMGAAGISCVNMLVQLGLKPENILAFDREGVIHTGRTDLDPEKQRYARDTDKRTLAEIVDGADIFLGLSAPGILTADMVKTMAPDPVIFALANPTRKSCRRWRALRVGRDHRHRPFGLPEPGQQRAVLPVSVPWCAGRGCDRDQRGNEDRLRACHRRAGTPCSHRHGLGLRRRDPELRP